MLTSCTFIFLILILLYFLIILYKNKYGIHFLNKDELALILSCDNDQFYVNLSKNNLLLRNISNKDSSD